MPLIIRTLLEVPLFDLGRLHNYLLVDAPRGVAVRVVCADASGARTQALNVKHMVGSAGPFDFASGAKSVAVVGPAPVVLSASDLAAATRLHIAPAAQDAGVLVNVSVITEQEEN